MANKSLLLDSHPLGTKFTQKSTGKEFQLRQYPIQINTHEERVRYLMDVENQENHVTNPVKGEFKLKEEQ